MERIEIYQIAYEPFKIGAKCPEHNKLIYFSVDTFFADVPAGDSYVQILAAKALETCPECVQEREVAQQPSRWPEGAEL